MPLSKIPPTISLHPTDTPFSAEPQDYLTTTPPELLLQILSHLPPSTLYPLSLTSKYLHTFLLTHAATICNNAILTHYSHASLILRSTYEESGWLVPSHPAIINEERRLIRDKILFSGCKCPPCRLVLTSSSSTNLSISELDHVQGLSGLNCLAGLRPSTCKAGKEIEGAMKLSRPGPQYLVFLEKYSWEIVTRHSMGSLSHSTSTSSSNTNSNQEGSQAPSPTGTSSSTATATSSPDTAIATPLGNVGEEETEEDIERERQEREKEEAMFAFMIGNYCVRRFLDSAEKVLSSFSAATANDAPPPSPRFSPIINQGRKLGRKLRKRMAKRQRVEVREVEVAEVVPDRPRDETASDAPLPNQTPRRRMFGEISPMSETINVDEKEVLIKEKGVGERWEDGLLWYYGLQSLRSGDVEGGEDEEGEEMNEKVEGRNRGCIAVFKRGLGIVSRRIRGFFIGRCVGLGKLRVGGFRALEG